jgi:hypothetical protein
MCSVDVNGQKVLAVLTNVCKPVGDVMEIEEFSTDQSPLLESKHRYDHALASTSAAFLQSLFTYCQKQNYKTLILVSDNVSHPAFKLMASMRDIAVTYFSYKETCVGSISRHIYQPRLIVAEKPLPLGSATKPIAASDILMRYYGFVAGDTLRVEEADRQTGISIQYIRVV